MAGEPQTDCLFCKIVTGDIPATIVRESATTVAFRDINPQAPTHVLVIPKAHYPDAAALAAGDPQAAADVLREAGLVAADEKITETGYRIVLNTGAGCRTDRVPRARPRPRRTRDAVAPRLAGHHPCPYESSWSSAPPVRCRPATATTTAICCAGTARASSSTRARGPSARCCGPASPRTTSTGSASRTSTATTRWAWRA